ELPTQHRRKSTLVGGLNGKARRLEKSSYFLSQTAFVWQRDLQHAPTCRAKRKRLPADGRSVHTRKRPLSPWERIRVRGFALLANIRAMLAGRGEEDLQFATSSFERGAEQARARFTGEPE